MTFIIILVALAVHELSHAVAMRHYDIPIRRAGLGLPIPPFLYIKIPKLSFPLTISPFLLGAYVEPTAAGNELIKLLPYRQKAVIYGAGIVANLLMGLVLFAVLVIFVPSSGWDSTDKIIRLAVCVLGVAFLLRFISFFCSFCIIPLGVSLAVFLAILIGGAVLADPGQAVSSGADGQVIGPIGIAKAVSRTTSFSQVIMWGYFISSALAITNMLPLSILDGGRIFHAALEKIAGPKISSVSMALSSLLFVAFIIFVFVGDILRF